MQGDVNDWQFRPQLPLAALPIRTYRMSFRLAGSSVCSKSEQSGSTPAVEFQGNVNGWQFRAELL